IEQLKRLGASCDYEEERFTLDTGYAEAVLHVFAALYRKGYIYRDRYMVNWDPGSRSAISDLEVEDREVTDTLYYIDYPLAPGSDPNDFEIGQRHGLQVLTVIGEDGRVTDEAPERFAALPIGAAQEAVVAELREQGLIARAEPYTHTVPFSHRSGERIEPLV